MPPPHRAPAHPSRPIPITQQALQRLPWPVGKQLTVAGVPIAVRSSSERDWETIEGYLPTGRPLAGTRQPRIVYSFTPIDAPRVLEPANQHVLYRGTERLIRSKDLTAVLKTLSSDLHWQVAAHTRSSILVHAGAVAYQGRGVIMPGHSRAGKSTLVAALLRRGATYYSDEAALIDRRGLLHPLGEPIWLEPRGTPAGTPKQPLAPAALGARLGRAACAIQLIAFPEWAPHARRRVTPLAEPAVLASLLLHTLVGTAHPARTLTFLTRTIKDAMTVHIRYAEADDAAEVLIDLLDRMPRADGRPVCPAPRSEA